MIPNSIMPKVRTAVQFMDPLFQQEGLLTYSGLEEALQQVAQDEDKKQEVDLATQIGIRFNAMATGHDLFARSLGESAPSKEDVLEAATGFLEHALMVSIEIEDSEQEKVARNRLGDCLFQSRQFSMSLEHLEASYQIATSVKDPYISLDSSQKIGDCYIELKRDQLAYSWYQKAMDFALEIDDPLETHTVHGKLAGALRNLQEYEQALDHLAKSKELLERLGKEKSLQKKVTVRKNQFTLAAIPNLISYLDTNIMKTNDAVGRDLLIDLHSQIAKSTLAIVNEQEPIDPSDWKVYPVLPAAILAGIRVLANEMGISKDTFFSPMYENHTLLQRVGTFVRTHFEENIPNPESDEKAARLLSQIDRSRRAAIYVKRVEETKALAGPFGGGNSKHVVYLRSFIASPYLPSYQVEPWGEVDLEDLLACRLDPSPLIALGNPELSRFGPGRAQTSDENWREVLRVLVYEAQILLVLPAPTEGTSWEVEWVVANKFLHKTCFIMPPSKDEKATWWNKKWNQLKEWAVHLGINLPAYDSKGSVFRLTSEGGIDQMDISELFSPDDLHMKLLTGLLFLPNLSFDFLYGIQQTLEEKSPQTKDSLYELIGTGQAATDAIHNLKELEAQRRYEFSNWQYDEPNLPEEPGVLMYYLNPFRLLWVEQVDNLKETLAENEQGQPSDFLRAFFHFQVLPKMGAKISTQLLKNSLKLESLMSFRIKQQISYRLLPILDPKKRSLLVELIRKGGSRNGAPEYKRVETE